MKRDLELCRSMLIQIEAADDCIDFEDLAPWEKRNVAWYHLGLLCSAGFVDAAMVESDDGLARKGKAFGLTWDGQDYLDAIRDDELWRKVSKAIKDSVGSTTFGVVKQVATNACVLAANAALHM